MREQNKEAVFYPKQGKILINAYFYSFWISVEEFKKYNLEYKIYVEDKVQGDNCIIEGINHDGLYENKAISFLTNIAKKLEKIRI